MDLERKGEKDENPPQDLIRKDWGLRNLPHQEEGGSQSEVLDGSVVALAHKLVSGLESLPGVPGRTGKTIADRKTGKGIGGKKMKLNTLVGSGDRIMLLTLPFVIVGLILNILIPSLFSVGGPSTALRVTSIVILLPGVTIWIWSIILLLTRIPKGELITYGPYSLVKHPLYTGVAFLVLPWLGLLFNTWLGVAIGIVLYIASRLFSSEEEKMLSQIFGTAWDEYCHKVVIPWL